MSALGPARPLDRADNTFRQVGIAAGIAALGSIFTSAIGRHLPGTGLALVGALCAALLIRRKDFHRPGGAGTAPPGHAAAETEETVG